MAVLTSSDPRGDFWTAFFNRTNQWQYVSQQKAGLLADCAVAQAMFESASWSSPLCLNYSNAIGYKYYSLSDWQEGPANVSPEGDHYASYASIADCACELADWIHRRASDFADVEDIGGYLDTMSQDGYATVPASQYAHAEQYYSATDLSGYSADQPSVLATAAALVQTGATTNYGLIAVGAVLVVVLFFVTGGSRLLKRLFA